MKRIKVRGHWRRKQKPHPKQYTYIDSYYRIQRNATTENKNTQSKKNLERIAEISLDSQEC